MYRLGESPKNSHFASAEYGNLVLADAKAIKDAIRPLMDNKPKYREMGAEEERVESLFERLKSAGVTRHTDAVNVRIGDYGELISPNARPLVEKIKRRESVTRVAFSILISQNVTNFVFDLMHSKNKRIIDLDPQLTQMFTDEELRACIIREDFHNNKKSIFRNGAISLLASGVSMGSAIVVYLNTLGTFKQLMDQFSNFFLSGPDFGLALALFSGAGTVRSISMSRINKRRERKADMIAVSHVGPDATASMLLKTQAALEISREGHRRCEESEIRRSTRLLIGKIMGAHNHVEKRVALIYARRA